MNTISRRRLLGAIALAPVAAVAPQALAVLPVVSALPKSAGHWHSEAVYGGPGTVVWGEKTIFVSPNGDPTSLGSTASTATSFSHAMLLTTMLAASKQDVTIQLADGVYEALRP